MIKKIVICIVVLMAVGLLAKAQTDSVVYYDALEVYRIDTSIITGSDTITSDSNMVWQTYHYIEKIDDNTFIYQPQFIVYDSLINRLLPNFNLIDSNWRSSGTVKEWVIDSTLSHLAPDSLRTLYVLPELNAIYGSDNVTKLD